MIKVLGVLGPRPLGPWDLGYLGLKVWGPKVRGLKAQGLMALESESIILKTEPKSKEMVGRRERRRASRAGITNSHLSAYLMISSLILSAHIFDSLLLYQSKYIL